MGIRLKILLAFVLCFGAMAGAGLILLERSVNESYRAIEQSDITANMGRVEQSFEASAASLKNQTRDWAVWSEMYRYALHPDPEWVQENVGDDALAPADISMVMIFDLDGRLLTLSTVKDQGVDLKVLTPQITPYLNNIRSRTHEAQCGIIRIDAGLLLACWAGIVPSDATGAPVGTVLMGRLLDAARLTKLREQTKLPFALDLQSPMPDGLERWATKLEPGLLGNGEFWAVSDPDVYHLFYPVQDILKQNAGLIALDVPRSVHRQGLLLYQQVRRQFGWMALLVTIALGLALHLMLIRRLRGFARQIGTLEERSDWTTRISIGGQDELGLVAKNFNRLLVLVHSQVEGLRELLAAKESAIKVIQATQAQLVESEKKALSGQRRVRNLLDNSGQGFLSFGRDLRIDPEVSRACEIMLACAPAGQNAAQVLFGNDPLKASLFCEIIPAALAEPDPDIRASMLSLLPAEIMRGDALLRADYKTLEEQRFMVVLTDITEERRLGAMLQSERQHLELVVKAVSDTRSFFDAINAFRDFLAHDVQCRLDEASALELLVQALYREIHTFKGLFSQLGFIHTPKQLHDIETRLSGEEAATRASVAGIVSPADLQRAFDKDLSVLTDVLGKRFLEDGESVRLSSAQAEQLEDLALRLLQGKSIDTSSDEIRRLLNDIVMLRKQTLNAVLLGFDGLVRQVAGRLGKDVAPIEVKGGENLWIDLGPYQTFLHCLGHVFRNAVVHGIESPEDRWATGKAEAGRIICQLALDKRQIRLSIADDGAGLDLDALRHRAVASGIYAEDEVGEVSDEEIAHLIFRDQLTVHDSVTELSGRGFGLAAVLAETRRLGGEVAIKNSTGKGCEFLFALPLQHCNLRDAMFACTHPLSKDVAAVMRSIINKVQAYFESEYQIAVSDVCAGGGALESLVLLDMTAMIGFGGQIGLRVAFSFQDSLVDALYAQMTAGFNDIPEEVEKHREAVTGEVVNIVLGHCTADLQHLDQHGIPLTPPHILGRGVAISGADGDMFYTQGFTTERGRLAISLVGSRGLFDMDRDYAK